PSPSMFPQPVSTTTFSKESNDQRQRNVAILEDISNHAKSNNRSDDSHHFNFTRQKSDLTHSKTSENVALGGKSSKASVRSQLRGSQKNRSEERRVGKECRAQYAATQ